MQTYSTALYGRTSKDDPKKVTIDIQRQRLQAWAAADDQVARVVDGYWDDGVSGKIELADRPEGARLLADVRSGKVQCVAVAYADRFGRTLRDGLNAVKLLEEFGVKLVTIDEGWDGRRADSPLFFQLRMMMAEEEHRRIAQRMSAGKLRAMDRDNAPPGGPLTFGYRLDGKGAYVIDPTEAPVVIGIFERALLGESNHAILAWVRTTGIPAGRKFQKRAAGAVPTVCRHHQGASWHLSKVAKILSNAVYVGVRKWGDRSFPCPPLVTQESFDQVAGLTGARRRIYGHKTTPETCLCSALFTCGNCGKKFYHVPTVSYRRNGTVDRYSTYKCESYRGKGSCRAKMVRVDDLDKRVWDTVVSYLSDPEAIVRQSIAKEASIRATIDEFQSEEDRLSRDLVRIDREAAALLEESRVNAWPVAWVAPRLSQMNAERVKVAEALRQLRTERAGSMVDVEQAAAVVSFLAEVRAALGKDVAPAKRHEIIRLLVAGGTITTTGAGRQKTADVVIRFRWSDVASGKNPSHWSYGSNPDTTIPVSLSVQHRFKGNDDAT